MAAPPAAALTAAEVLQLLAGAVAVLGAVLAGRAVAFASALSKQQTYRTILWRNWIYASPARTAWYKRLRRYGRVGGASELDDLLTSNFGGEVAASPASHGWALLAVEGALVHSALAGPVYRTLLADVDRLALAHADANADADADADAVGRLTDEAARTIAAQKHLRPVAEHALPGVLRQLAHYHGWVERLQRAAATPYDATNAAHEQLLQRLWRALSDDTLWPARRGDHWQALGFQGDDPATDFRGMGILGLHSLVHFAEAHRDVARRVLLQSQHPVRWFPFAITGISVANFVRKLLRDPVARRIFVAAGGPAAPPADDVYFEAVSWGMLHFGACWAEAPEDITQFPAVFARFEAHMRAWLEQHEALPPFPPPPAASAASGDL